MKRATDRGKDGRAASPPKLPAPRLGGRPIAAVATLALAANACAAFGVHFYDVLWLLELLLVSVVMLLLGLTFEKSRRAVAVVLVCIMGALVLGARNVAGCFLVSLGEPTEYQKDWGAWLAWLVFPFALLAVVVPLFRAAAAAPRAILPALRLRAEAAAGIAALSVSALVSLRAVDGELALPLRALAASSLAAGLAWAAASLWRARRAFRIHRRAAEGEAGMSLAPAAPGDEELPALLGAGDAGVIAWSASRERGGYRTGGNDSARIARAPGARDGLPPLWTAIGTSPVRALLGWLFLAFVHGMVASDPDHPPRALAISFRHQSIERVHDPALEIPGVSIWQIDRGASYAAYDHRAPGEERVIEQLATLLPRYPPGTVEETAARIATLRHNCRLVTEETIRYPDGRTEQVLHPPRLVGDGGYEIEFFCRSAMPGGFEARMRQAVAPLRIAP